MPLRLTGRGTGGALVAFGAALVLAYSLAPFLWLLIASVTPELKADFSRPWLSNRAVTYLPSSPTLDNYRELLNNAAFLAYFRNSSIIATGNMLPSWVKIVCVDINPAVATKVSDRGTGQAVGVVTDVGLFLDLLARTLEA